MHKYSDEQIREYEKQAFIMPALRGAQTGMRALFGTKGLQAAGKGYAGHMAKVAPAGTGMMKRMVAAPGGLRAGWGAMSNNARMGAKVLGGGAGAIGLGGYMLG